MITIDASNAESGIDFETFVRGDFLADQSGGGFPVFDNGTAFDGTEMFLGYGTGATDKYVLARGEIAYSFATHTVWGSIDTVEYGRIGSGDFDDDGAYTGGNVQLRITGLDFANAQPANPTEETEIEANGVVHNFSVAHMYGNAGDPDKMAVYADALDNEAQHFIGSDFADIFTGTGFDDIIEGGGGSDLLAGNGGNDLIDGGDDFDTAVFAGNFADYLVVRYADGRTVVSPSAVSAGTGETTLKNIESVAFDDQTIAVEDLAVLTARGRLTIDASMSGGVDFTAYLAAYFAATAGEGTYAFHGGTVDNAYGQQFYLNGDQLSFQYAAADDPEGDSVYVAVLDGEEIAYDFIHHGSAYGHDISGAVDAMTFATITGEAPESGPDAFTGYEAEIVISGFGLADAPDATDGEVNALYEAFMGADATAIEALLAQYAQDFLGSDGDDTFVGSQFDDNIFGRNGADTLGGSGGDDLIKGNRGRDDLSGGDGVDTLVGGRGKDTLSGGADADILVGGKGKDVLTGGADADVFVFKGFRDSGGKAKGRDKILDFSTDDGDQIDLTGFGGLDFIGGSKFSGDGDELRVVERKSGVVVKVDAKGGPSADFSIKVMGADALFEDDFLL